MKKSIEKQQLSLGRRSFIKSTGAGLIGASGMGILPSAVLASEEKAVRWTRFPDVDINRCVKVLNDAKYKGYISFEYEAGGDPVAGTLKLMEDVVESLT